MMLNLILTKMPSPRLFSAAMADRASSSSIWADLGREEREAHVSLSGSADDKGTTTITTVASFAHARTHTHVHTHAHAHTHTHTRSEERRVRRECRLRS